MYEQEWLKETLYRFGTEYKGKEAFVVYDGKNIKTISFKEYLEDIQKISGKFRQRKMIGNHIAVAGKNSYEWFVLMFAIWASGNVLVPLNAALPQEEQSRQCEFADVDYIFREECSESSGEYPDREKRSNEFYIPEFFEDKDIQKPLVPDEICPIEKEQLFCLMFTSGTCGANKAVMLTAGNLFAALSNDRLERYNIQRSMSVLPLYHISGIKGIGHSLFYGKTICLGRGIRYIFQDMPVLNPNHVSMVPGIMNTLVRILKSNPDRESRKKYIGENLTELGVGGAMADEENCRFLLEQGFHLGTGYALTETTGCGLAGFFMQDNLRTLGEPENGVSCRIEEGELLLSGKTVMAGYYKSPEKTKKVLKEGWLYTGDIGKKDADGLYYLSGRKKNVIILANGENISPEELEKQLQGSEDVLECMVYGSKKGIIAEIYTKREEAVLSYVGKYNKTVPMDRQIAHVICQRTPLEKTGSGKIKRKENVL